MDEVLNALGQVMHIREEMFNTFTAFSNVGPMWLYKMTEALIDAGVYIGFSRTDARNIAIKNMAGVAGVLEITGEHPAVKLDQICLLYTSFQAICRSFHQSFIIKCN